EGDSVLEVLLQVVHNDPPRPRSLDRDVDRDLEAVCLACLEKAPNRRLPSAAALADELERWLAGEPVRTRPLSLWERGRRWARRRPAVAALTALAVGLAVAGAVGVGWEWRRETRARREAQRLSATLALRQAWRLGEQGEVGPALLWLNRALELSPEDLRGT